MKALVVLSGGQDSATLLFWAKKRFEEVAALTFDYGQRHRVEIECSQRLCDIAGVSQKILNMDFLAQLNTTALTSKELPVETSGGFHNLPSTFVPGRNILFLTLAASYAVPRGMDQLVIGVCQTDYSGYPDCREEFVAAMEKSLQAGLDTPTLRVHRPLMFLNKAQTFALADELGCLETVLEHSHTCYEGERGERHEWGYGCGHCPACVLRRRGYELYKRATGSTFKPLDL